MKAKPSLTAARKVLRDVFGHAHLRRGQAEVIERVLAGQSTLALMPTGAGKSLCYQLPALLLDGCTLVVTPLISLMRDQCEKLREIGVAAVQLNSQLTAEELRHAEEAIDQGTARIVLTTPERLADLDFMARFQKRRVALLAVDEAHCIAQWGHDFRPAFLDIAAAAALGSPPVLALTATAGDDVAKEVMKQLRIPSSGLIVTGVFRPNLHYAAEQVQDDATKLRRTLGMVTDTEGAGIVYTATVKSAEQVFSALQATDVSVALYHGKLGARERREARDGFMSGRVRVMVATNAFGMGIDKADIRFVVHYQLPASLEAYYQESGRAGRDRGSACCTLLFRGKDRALQQFFLAGRYPSADDLEHVHRQILAPSTDGGWTVKSLLATLDGPPEKMHAALALLRQEKVVTQNRQSGLAARETTIAPKSFAAWAASYERRRTEDRATLERMVFYAQTGGCRWQVLLADLDASVAAAACGTCDNCRRIAEHRASMAGPILIQDVPAPVKRPMPTFSEGDLVVVKRYGQGMVTSADVLSVTVEFADGSRRCFQSDFVRRANSPLRTTARGVAAAALPLAT